MKNKHILCSLFIFLCASFNIQNAFSQQFQKRIYSSKNGLSQNDVQNIYEDSKGFIWISTIGGLNRFDGNEFIKYKAGDCGLKTGQINSVVEDKNGNLFVATYFGIYFYDRRKNEFYPLSSSYDEDGILAGTAKYLMVDSNDDIWYYMPLENKIVRIKYDYDRNRIVSLFCYDKNLKDSNLKDIIQIKDKILFAGKNGLHFYDLKSKKFSLDSRLHDLTSFCVISDSILLLSIEYDGIYSYNIDNREIKKNISIIGKTLIQYKNGFLYYINNEKLYKLKYSSLNNIDRVETVIDSYSSCFLKSLYISDKNIIWLGILREGVIQYSNVSNYFKLYKDDKLKHISCIYEDYDKNIWVGTEGYGLLFFGNKGFKSKPISTFFHNKTVYDIKYSKHDDNYYAAVYLKGVIVSSSSKFEKYSLIPNTKTARKLIFDSKYIWIALYNGGVLRYNIETKKSLLLTESDGLISNIVRNILKDRYGNLWIATDNGLSFIKASKRHSNNPIIINPSGKNFDKYVISFMEDSDGFLWVGTIGRGLWKYSFTKNGFLSLIKKMTIDNGLPNNTINDIEEDDNGKIWISSNYGLQVLDETRNIFSSFNMDDGLQDYEFDELATKKLKSGKILFGGCNGVNAIDPNNFEISNEKKMPFMVDFLVNNSSLIKDSLKSLNFSLENIILDHNQKNFTFVFSTLEFLKPYNIKYKYKLEGYDNEWKYTTSKRKKADYYNVPNGKYKFLLMASNSDGAFSEQVLCVSVIVVPPFWKKKSFLFLCFLIICVVCWNLIIKYVRYNKNKKKKINLEIEKKIIDKVLDNRVCFFDSISHEFRIPLTLIISPLEKVINDIKCNIDDSLMNPLRIAYSNSLILLQLIEDYLSYSGKEENKIMPSLEIFDIVQYCRETVNQFLFISKEKDVNLIFNSNCKSFNINYDKNMFQHIIYNLLSNAIKHTPSGKNVIFSIFFEDEKIVVSVKDEGRGLSNILKEHIFDKYFSWENYKNKRTGIGLFFTKQMVENLNGSIDVVSEINEGTVFKVCLPLVDKNLIIKESRKDVGIYGKILEKKTDTIEALLASDVFKIKNAKMLVLDTDIEIINIIKNIFSPVFQIISSDNIVEGMDKAKKCYPDIIITGINMCNKKDENESLLNLDYCAKLKEDPKTSHIPIIFISDKIDSNDIGNVYENMVDILCRKPFHSKNLVIMVASLLKNRKILIEKFSSELSVLPIDKIVSLSDYDFINRITNILEKNISNSAFTSQILEEQLGLSRYLLAKKIKEIYGLSPSAYIRDVRLNKALSMLKSGNYLVSEVTLAVGFSDLRYFRECFKNKFNTLPNSYKKSVS